MRATTMRRADAVGSRQRIHRVALALFARYGHDAVSLQQIADEVGLHKSSLFHHYRSKTELLDEVLAAVIDEIMAVVRPSLEGSLGLDTFYAGVDQLVDHFSAQPEAARVLLSAMTAPEDSDLRKGGRAIEFYLALVGWFERARRAKIIGAVNIQQAIPNLIGLVLTYPAIAHDLGPLVGPEPFGARAREIRKRELRLVLAGMLEPR